MRLFRVFFFFLILACSSSFSHAWGPGAHIDYALHVLSNLTFLSPLVVPLLRKFPHDFLYGNIAADIILTKKYAGELYHCHHWEVVLPLLDRAKDERQRAFIYGYLTHLAVDTVSHNYFVPFTTIRSYQSLTLRHVYWEMCFDLEMPSKVWKILESIASETYEANDLLLSRSLKQGLFSFKTNKRIFNNLMLLQKTHTWKQVATLLANRSNNPLAREEVHEFRTLCHEVAVDFLTHLQDSKVLRADPTGKLKQLYAKQLVTHLRQYTRRALFSQTEVANLIKKVKVSLKEGIYKPVELPEIYDLL